MEPPPRPPRALPEELVEEILLRFPPDDPASLVRAALVCKPWCRLLSRRGFRRRFGQFHRTPPTLGLVCNLRDEDQDSNSEEFAHFVPASPFCSPRALCRKWRAIDARHGRVLVHDSRWGRRGFIGDTFAIWDPIADELWELPILRPYKGRLFWRAAVLSTGGDACNHLDCNQEPFQVVIVATDLKQIHACIYSSEVGAWSQPTPQLQHPNDYFSSMASGALVENVLYFPFMIGANILEYSLATQKMSVIHAPVSFYKQRNVLTAEGGRLGITIAKDSNFYLWTRETGPEGDTRWTQSRVIELENLLPVCALATSPYVVGADGTGVYFVLTGDGLYAIDVKTSQVKKVCNRSGSLRVFPYTSFYTPVLMAAYR